MNLLNRFRCILIALQFAASPVLAQVTQDLQELVLTGDLYGRSSLDFRKNAKNVQYTIPEGSEGTVLETRKLSRTGSYGIKVRLTKINGAQGRNTPKPGDETWVYFSQKEPWLTFKDKEGSEVQDPEIALISRAKRDGEGIPAEGVAKAPHLPTKAEILREQKPAPKMEDPNLGKSKKPQETEAGFCVTCHATPPTATDRNREDLQEIQRELARSFAASESSPSDKKWSQFPDVIKYSGSDRVNETIAYGLRNKERRSKRLCYRYVKRALLAGDLVNDYLPGTRARFGVSDLKRRGFINLMEDPRYKQLISHPDDAPKGAILIYRNTRDRHHAGHIEIKTDWGDKGGYFSDFYRSTDSSLHNRELIGVMIKENP